MNNKKIIIVLFLTILTVVILLFNFYGAKNTNSYIQDDNSIAVMVYNATNNNYVVQNNVPTGNYILNEHLSYCEGTGEVSSYDSSLGKVTTLIDGQDKCYYYFNSTKSVTFTGNTFSNYSTYCQPQYSMDGGNTYENINIPSGSGSVTLPVGAIVKIITEENNPSEKYECDIHFCTSSSCSANYESYSVRDAYNKTTTIHTLYNYTITGNENYYATYVGVCFVEDTLVEVWDRKKKKKIRKKIKDININDIIYTYSYTSGKVRTAKVKGITINKTREIYHLVFENDELLTTADHPFCVSGAGYLNASMLKKGYELIGSDGKSYTLKDIFVETVDYDKEMYCLELENGDSIFVGKNGVVALSMYASVLIAMGFSIKPSEVYAVY
jgi:hypothetical protein